MTARVISDWGTLEIQQLRRAMRLSIRAFSDYLGVSTRMITRWERGARPQSASAEILDTALRRADRETRARFWTGLVAIRGAGRCDQCGGWLDPAVNIILEESEEARALLACRDIAGIYRLLQRNGVSQRRIAALTGQSQSEVSEIMKGRRVLSYDVLVRIADGLGVPRARMGLGLDVGGPE